MKFRLFALAGAAVALTVSLALPVLAAEPTTATIKKTVQNQTTNSDTVDANDADSALSAKSGDILRYTVTLTNNAKATIDDDGKLININLTDALPSGVELISDPNHRSITEELPTLGATKNVSKQYLVKVTGKDGDVITNKACFTAKYEGKDDRAAACDDAVVKVGAAAPTPSAPTTPAPATPQTPAPAQPAATDDGKLPTTGPGDTAATIALIGIASVFAYALRMYLYTRKSAA